MGYDLEAIALLTELSLPDGYRIREVAGRLYLFDRQGIPLHAPKDPARIEAYAWRHAWGQVVREVNEEMADVRAGVRSLHSSHRLRQYMRMLDAVAQAENVAEERPVRRGLVAWGVLAASAAAIAAVFLSAPLRTTRVPERLPAASRPATVSVRPAASAPPAEPTSPERVGMGPAARAVEMSHEAVGTGAGPRGPAFRRYAVSFGTFVNRATANTMMHFIRSKGYIVYVARIGEDFWVVTRPYRTRAQAERLVGALQEIGLPAQLADRRGLKLLTFGPDPHSRPAL